MVFSLYIQSVLYITQVYFDIFILTSFFIVRFLEPPQSHTKLILNTLCVIQQVKEFISSALFLMDVELSLQ